MLSVVGVVRKGKNAVQARKKLTAGRPVEADKDAIKALVDANRRITTREIGLRLNLPNSTVIDHLKCLGLSSKIDLLPDNTTINSEVYCHELDKLNDALQQKRSELIYRKGVVFHQDNASPHTSLVTRQKLLQLVWDTIPHPPYSPDLAPLDYYLFRSLQNFSTCTTSHEDRQIVYMAVTDRSVTSRNVAQHIESVTHHSVSTRTIRCHLQQIGLSAIRPLFDLALTQNDRCLRRQWCNERRIGRQNGMNFSLLTSHASVCNTTMVEFESGDTEQRGC
ncbi:histone-lysine N-methyltransferase SETMAR [Trichonephila clavipes]|nr:histone-lysine N-methyltransferase SETMAR [Trichonephila clavipes]